MDLQKLERAKELQHEIDELSAFLSHDGWRDKLFRTKVYYESPVAFLVGYNFKTYEIPDKLKDKLKSVMQDYLANLLDDLENL